MKLDTTSKMTLIGVFAMQNTIAASMAKADLDDKKETTESLTAVFGAAAVKDFDGYTSRNQMAWLLANLVRDCHDPKEVSKHLSKIGAHGLQIVGVDIRKTFDDFLTDIIGNLKNPSPLKNAQTADQFGISGPEFTSVRTALETAGFGFNGNTIQSVPAVAPAARQKQSLNA